MKAPVPLIHLFRAERERATYSAIPPRREREMNIESVSERRRDVVVVDLDSEQLLDLVLLNWMTKGMWLYEPAFPTEN